MEDLVKDQGFWEGNLGLFRQLLTREFLKIPWAKRIGLKKERFGGPRNWGGLGPSFKETRRFLIPHWGKGRTLNNLRNLRQNFKQLNRRLFLIYLMILQLEL